VTARAGVDSARFRVLLGRFASGVTVLTTRDQSGQPLGMTASAVTSASLDPPLVLVCVDQRAELHPFLERGVAFVLNVLAADQEDMSRRFAAEERDRFAGLVLHESTRGLPVLDGIAAYVECDWHGKFPTGDHTAFLGLVTGGSVNDRRPLLHYRGGYGTVAGG
jgi:flavin reductase (DIM6/NTAB) family NADH-FMN oxidoreductase RutF